MKFIETPLKGAFEIELEKKEDERGFFARLFCSKEFEKKGLQKQFVQINNSLSARQGTLRGMHYQLAPHSEVKVIRCIRGALYDVILDLREDSPTFGQSFATELSADNRKMVYIPHGIAHGFLTLQDQTEAFYLSSEFYSPQLERAVRWNDPTFNISWPSQPTILSEKDRNHRDFDPSYHLNSQGAFVL